MSQEVPQHLQALAMANEKRSQQARLKHRVRLGELPVETVIAVHPEVLKTGPNAKKPITILDILTWPRGVWTKVEKRRLRGLGIPVDAELHELSAANRAKLIRSLQKGRPRENRML